MGCSPETLHLYGESDMSPPVFWIVGGPGSGKGTQCEKLRAKYGFAHLSSGDLLRSEVMANTARGLQIFGTMERGNLVPDAVVIELLAEAIAKSSDSKGILLDGFPANLEQAQLFEKMVGAPGKIVVFDLNEKTKPVVASYSVIKVNADQDKEAVFSDICKIM